jgi:D-3-phosphoglycerate dehydrogenase/(S)-sulfolactate dehydrogenase
VFEHEPTSADNPLRQLPNVVPTPHAAGAVASLRRRERPAEEVVHPEVRAASRR